ncbi:substrate-binding periplasmic protein [Chitinimonas naiadis]
MIVAAQATEPIGIGYFSGSARSKICALIMVEIYKRAKIDTVPVSLPGARNAVAAEASEIIGESGRVTGYTNAHPTLTQVTPPISVWTTVAFYKHGIGVRLNVPADLKNYTVGYVRGTRSAEDVVTELGLTKLEAVSTPNALFKMLNADRFEVAIDGGTNGSFHIRRGGYQGIDQFQLNSIPLYHILSPKYKDLAPTLSDIIQRMAASGELAKIAMQKEKEVLESSAEP